MLGVGPYLPILWLPSQMTTVFCHRREGYKYKAKVWAGQLLLLL